MVWHQTDNKPLPEKKYNFIDTNMCQQIFVR